MKKPFVPAAVPHEKIKYLFSTCREPRSHNGHKFTTVGHSPLGGTLSRGTCTQFVHSCFSTGGGPYFRRVVPTDRPRAVPIAWVIYLNATISFVRACCHSRIYAAFLNCITASPRLSRPCNERRSAIGCQFTGRWVTRQTAMCERDRALFDLDNPSTQAFLRGLQRFSRYAHACLPTTCT